MTTGKLDTRLSEMDSLDRRILDSETIDGYEVLSDPMDDLQCESCQ